jgi:hypothetical protein
MAARRPGGGWHVRAVIGRTRSAVAPQDDGAGRRVRHRAFSGRRVCATVARLDLRSLGGDHPWVAARYWRAVAGVRGCVGPRMRWLLMRWLLMHWLLMHWLPMHWLPMHWLLMRWLLMRWLGTGRHSPDEFGRP